MRKPLVTILFFIMGCAVIAQQSQPSARLKEALAAGLESPKTKKLDLTVNSDYSEFNPLISPDGNILYFSRFDHPQNMGEENLSDIWAAYRQLDGSWGRAINLGGPANDRRSNQLAGINSKGNLIYIASYDADGQWQGMAASIQNGRRWSLPQKMDFTVDSLLDLREFYFSADGHQMFFTAIDRINQQRDIYVAHFDTQRGWLSPKNLGAEINSPHTEASPYLATDGKTLYFASDNRSGYGGFDLYVSRREGDDWYSWSKPENLGPTINTSRDEYGCSLPASGDFIYYASGDSLPTNIYQSFLPDQYRPSAVVLLSGKILDGETYQPLELDLNVQPLNREGIDESSVFIRDGNFHLLVPEGTDLGLYAAIEEGYFPVSEVMEMSDNVLEELDGGTQEGSNEVDKEEDTYSYIGQQIEKNKLKLQRLNREIEQLDQQRWQTTYPKLENKYHPKIPLRSRYRSNPELDALRRRYHEIQREKEEELLQKTQPKGQEQTSSSRPNNLNDAYQAGEKDKGPQVPSDAVQTDQELQELQEKFYQFYYEGNPNGPSQRDKNDMTDLGSDTNKAFEKLERRMFKQLKSELRYPVVQELQKELVESELLKLQKEMKPSERRMGNRPFRKAVKKSLENLLEERENIYQQQQEEETTKENTPFEKDLKAVLYAEAKSELKEQLTGYIRNTVREEWEYQLQKVRQQRLGVELQEHIQQNKVAKKRKGAELSEPLTPANPPESREVIYEEIEKNILLMPIKEGQIIPLNNVFFEANTATLKEVSYHELERVFSLLDQQAGLSVEIGGHTNSWLPESNALALTKERAGVIRNYLLGKGIAPERVQAKGYGSERPLISNATLLGRKKNQRIELKIQSVN